MVLLKVAILCLWILQTTEAQFMAKFLVAVNATWMGPEGYVEIDVTVKQQINQKILKLYILDVYQLLLLKLSNWEKRAQSVLANVTLVQFTMKFNTINIQDLCKILQTM